MVKATQQVSALQYCSLARRPVAGNGYSALPADLLRLESLLSRSDSHYVHQLNKYLCRTLLGQFSVNRTGWILPDHFVDLYHAQLDRIERNLSAKPDDYFSFGNDPFRKDIAILRYRLIPCGAEFFTPFSGLARSLVFKGGARQGIQFLAVVGQCRGTKPFLELHMHPQVTQDFTPRGWLATYENLADFLAHNAAFLGVQSTSWFLDPALEQISPHLAYLRQVPQHCGATIFYAGDEDPEHSGAFATSTSRRKLHAAGQYQPKRYTRIWSRHALLERRWRDSSRQF